MNNVLKSTHTSALPAKATTENPSGFYFKLYLFYIVSYFLHVPARLPFLGVIRIDMLMTLALFIGMMMQRKKMTRAEKRDPDALRIRKVSRILITLLVYCIATLPFVRWPGTVLNKGLQTLILAMMFFFFTYWLIDTEDRLKKFIAVLIGCQVFRIFEPLYLHLAYGYWGDQTWGAGEFFDRLSGSPYDVINPNGLAFVIATVIPFLHYFLTTGSFKLKLLYVLLLPPILYTMVLTLSRSGFVALAAIYGFILWRSKHKVLMICAIAISVAVAYPNLTEDQRERYLSITSSHSKFSGTSEGRMTGLEKNFSAAMQRPIFGHGLGASAEANYHAFGEAQPAHNLYLEILGELGFCGLTIYLVFIFTILKNFKAIREKLLLYKITGFLKNLLNGMEAWMAMNILFSFASYGLRSYEWYLFGGLSVAALRICLMKKESLENSIK